MKKIKTVVMLILLLGAGKLPLAAGEKEDLLKLIDEAAKKSLEYKKQLLKLEEAAENQRSLLKINESSVTVTGRLPFGSSPSLDSTDVSTGITVSVPILTQVSLEGSLDDSGGSSISLNLSPLTFDTTSLANRESYYKAENSFAVWKQRIALNLRSEVLKLVQSRMTLELVESRYHLEEEKLKALQASYEMGEADYQDLQDQEDALFKARQEYYDGESSLISQHQSLYTILGQSMGEAVIPEISFAVLEELIREERESLRGLEIPSSGELRNLELELDSLEQEMKVTFPFQPRLSLSAGVNLPYSGGSARASLTLTEDSIKIQERKDLKARIELKKEEIEGEKYRLSLEKEMLLKNISINEELLSLSRKDLTKAEVNEKETAFLFTRGERTSLEKEESLLELKEARIRLYYSGLNLLQALGNYRLLF